VGRVLLGRGEGGFNGNPLALIRLGGNKKTRIHYKVGRTAVRSPCNLTMGGGGRGDKIRRKEGGKKRYLEGADLACLGGEGMKGGQHTREGHCHAFKTK